ncbi:hypothetical protein LTR04_003834, partial [Oleoguttula sp. CCFEE 6159]
FTCPTGTEAANRARYNVPVWRYRYLGTWPNLQLYPTSGAYHGSELEMVFGTAEDVSGLPNTATENAVSRYTMKAWATFAAAPAHGLSGLGWPLYESEGKTLVRLGYGDETKASFVEPSLYDAMCPAVKDPSLAQGAF